VTEQPTGQTSDTDREGGARPVPREPEHRLVAYGTLAHWPRLDEFEGPGYRRVATTVRLPAGEADASVYVLATAAPT
jgi:hypothetical protein